MLKSKQSRLHVAKAPKNAKNGPQYGPIECVKYVNCQQCHLRPKPNAPATAATACRPLPQSHMQNALPSFRFTRTSKASCYNVPIIHEASTFLLLREDRIQIRRPWRSETSSSHCFSSCFCKNPSRACDSMQGKARSNSKGCKQTTKAVIHNLNRYAA